MAEDRVRRFVCQCLELQWNISSEECARQLARDDHLNWSSVRQLVNQQELAPFLYHLTRNRSILPLDLEREFSVAYYDTAGGNTLRLKELERVLGLLGAQGVAVILLKGAALIETLYGNAAVRPMGDVDLMVRAESLPMAMKVLSAYVDGSSSPEAQGPAVIGREREISFHKTGEANTVFDLHWQVLDSPFYLHSRFTDWLWESSVPLQVGAAHAMSLNREALLLHLCGHYLIDEGRKELLWLYDIASVVSKYRSAIDWDLLAGQARRYGLVLPVQHAISRITRVWENLIPRPVSEMVEGLSESRAERAFYHWVTSSDRAEVKLVGANLASMPNWAERLRYLGGGVFPPISYMRRRYGIRNPVLVWVTYPYRWLLSFYRAVVH